MLRLRVRYPKPIDDSDVFEYCGDVLNLSSSFLYIFWPQNRTERTVVLADD